MFERSRNRKLVHGLELNVVEIRAYVFIMRLKTKQ